MVPYFGLELQERYQVPDRGGIGLLTVEKVVSDHGGKCSVISEPGTFTEFTLSFPVRKGAPPATPVHILLSGFPDSVWNILAAITDDRKNIFIHQAAGADPAGNTSPESGIDLIIVHPVLTAEKKNREILLSLPEKYPDSDIVLFFSDDIPVHLLDIFGTPNVKLVPDRTMLITIINILATAINKEE